MTIGNWRVAEAEVGSLSHWRIEHKCGRHQYVWWPWTYSVINRGFQCEACYECPPEGIQAMFWFIKEG
jgi:hypothetical protein